MPARKRAPRAFTGGHDFSTDDDEPPIPTLKKPNLPKLRGTPSSRRQYTYGSDAEPVASPLNRHEQTVDLNNAVKGVLNRQQEDDQQSARARMPPPPKPVVNDEDNTDELAAGHSNPAAGAKLQEQPRRPGRPPKNAPSYLHTEDMAPPPRSGITTALEQKSQPVDAADATDDLRSFGTESDYFGDATIVSSPRNPLAASHMSKQASKPRPPPPSELPSNALQTSSSEEAEIAPAREPLTRPRISATLKPNDKPQIQPALTSKPRRSPRKTRPAVDSVSLDPQKESQQVDVLRQGRALLGLRASRVTFCNGGAREQTFASHHSEQDDAIQQEIEASEARSQSAAASSPWRDRWMKVQALSPFRASARHSSLEETSSEEDQEQAHERQAPREFLIPGESGIDWARILNPDPYFQPILKVLDSTLDWISIVASLIKRYIARAFGTRTASLGMSALLLVLASILFAIFVPQDSLPELGECGATSPASWSLGSKFEQIGGYIKSIPLPRWRRDESGLWDLGDGLHEVEDYLRQYEKEFASVKKTGLLHDDAIKRLQSIVPSVVHMDLKNGKPVVSDGFWHAIRDLVREDEHILSIGEDGQSQATDDGKWRVVATKVSTHPIFQSELNRGLKRVEQDIDQKIATRWNDWKKENDERIRNLIRPLLEKGPVPTALDVDDLDARIEELVQKKLRNSVPSQEGLAVPREEFLRHLKNEFAAHRSEVRSELDELKPRLEQQIRDAIAAANTHQPAPDTMTREEVTSLVNSLLRKSLSEASLEALANGKIHAHFDIEMKNEVNHFAQGAGATVNHGLSSKTYDAFGRGVTKDYSRGVRGPLPYPHIAALDPWVEEGDCWCAARDASPRGNPHGVTLAVQLARRVIPEYFAIDHILPGATTEPGARPREIEIHADIEDPVIRERVRDFSLAHFPEPTEWDSHPANLPRSFVKIGRFAYEGAELHDGTQLYRFSEELLHMGAATDQVAVRAVSNYGAPNHTCFYRLRLFGKQMKD